MKVTFIDLGNFHGKVKVKLVNEVTGKSLFQETTSLKKDNKETYKYNAGNSKVGDRMNFKVSYKFPAGGIGGWGEGFNFQKTVAYMHH